MELHTPYISKDVACAVASAQSPAVADGVESSAGRGSEAFLAKRAQLLRNKIESLGERYNNVMARVAVKERELERILVYAAVAHTLENEICVPGVHRGLAQPRQTADPSVAAARSDKSRPKGVLKPQSQLAPGAAGEPGPVALAPAPLAVATPTWQRPFPHRDSASLLIHSTPFPPPRKEVQESPLEQAGQGRMEACSPPFFAPAATCKVVEDEKGEHSGEEERSGNGSLLLPLRLHDDISVGGGLHQRTAPGDGRVARRRALCALSPENRPSASLPPGPALPPALAPPLPPPPPSPATRSSAGPQQPQQQQQQLSSSAAGRAAATSKSSAQRPRLHIGALADDSTVFGSVDAGRLPPQARTALPPSPRHPAPAVKLGPELLVPLDEATTCVFVDSALETRCSQLLACLAGERARGVNCFSTAAALQPVNVNRSPSKSVVGTAAAGATAAADTPHPAQRRLPLPKSAGAKRGRTSSGSGSGGAATGKLPPSAASASRSAARVSTAPAADLPAGETLILE